MRKIGLSERQIKAILYVKEYGKITNKDYQKISGVSKATATRDLSELVNLNILTKYGTGKRDIHYTLMRQK